MCAECPLCTRNCSGHSGEKLGCKKHGIHGHKDGIWGLLLGRSVDGEGTRVTRDGALAIRKGDRVDAATAWLFSLPGTHLPDTSTVDPSPLQANAELGLQTPTYSPPIQL